MSDTSTFIIACRGCCCGTAKDDKFDHDAQLRRFAAIPNATLRVVGCLNACTYSNVVVVRRRGEPAVWFSRMIEQALDDDLIAWVSDGAARGRLPLELRPLRLHPPNSTQPLELAT